MKSALLLPGRSQSVFVGRTPPRGNDPDFAVFITRASFPDHFQFIGQLDARVLPDAKAITTGHVGQDQGISGGAIGTRRPGPFPGSR